MEHHSATPGPVQIDHVKQKGTMVGRSTMNTYWLSTQLPHLLDGHTPVR